MMTHCRSKYSCKVSRYNKRHHILLYRETSTKNYITLTKNDALKHSNTQYA